MVGVHVLTIHDFRLHTYISFKKLSLDPGFVDLIATCVIFLFLYAA